MGARAAPASIPGSAASAILTSGDSAPCGSFNLFMNIRRAPPDSASSGGAFDPGPKMAPLSHNSKGFGYEPPSPPPAHRSFENGFRPHGRWPCFEVCFEGRGGSAAALGVAGVVARLSGRPRPGGGLGSRGEAPHPALLPTALPLPPAPPAHRPPPRRRLAQKPGVRAGESTDSGTRAEAAAASEEGWSSLGCPHFDVSLAQFSCGSMPPISKMNESTFLFFFSFLFL